MIEDITLVTVSFRSGLQAAHFSQTARYFKEVVVVDNASHDESAELFRKNVPHAKVLALTFNIGFGAGNNLGVREASNDLILLLNPDCQISEQDTLILRKTLLQFPSAVAIGPRVVGTNGKAHGTYRWTSNSGKRLPESYPDTWGVASTVKIDGCCMLIRKTHFESIGLFDEQLFMYFEEEDIGRRSIQCGLDILTTPFAVAVHQANQSSAPSPKTDFIKNYHLARSKLIMMSKYHTHGKMLSSAWLTLLVAPIAISVFALLGRYKHRRKWQARGLAALDWLQGRRRAL